MTTKRRTTIVTGTRSGMGKAVAMLLAERGERVIGLDVANADDIAPPLAFLASTDNRYMVGQVPYCDGGKDALLRGDDVIGRYGVC
jgi:NAD(P)-dependent dehydrogenase (short-subunit alcohol dehydrogenase family)